MGGVFKGPTGNNQLDRLYVKWESFWSEGQDGTAIITRIVYNIPDEEVIVLL
jgi:hypothetical protein